MHEFCLSQFLKGQNRRRFAGVKTLSVFLTVFHRRLEGRLCTNILLATITYESPL